MNYTPKTAYICMEFGLSDDIKLYTGGLGILAGDTIKSFADLGLPVVGVGILYKHGYLDQTLDIEQGQISKPQEWDYSNKINLIGKTTIPLANETVSVNIWEYIYTSSISNKSVSIILLDTDLPENSADFRAVSDKVYAPEPEIFRRQLIVLGLGSKYALDSLGCKEINTFHLNESHSALISLVIDHPSSQVVFTTHTPLLGGHTRLPIDWLKNICTEKQVQNLPKESFEDEQTINLTRLALTLADYSNAVSSKHQEVSQAMFPDHKIDYITNGIHSPTWVSQSIDQVLQNYFSGWKMHPEILRYIEGIPTSDIRKAHQVNKDNLANYLKEQENIDFLPDAFTIGFARRATEYKRANLIFSDIERLSKLAEKYKGINIIFAGKAYHTDLVGFDIIKRILNTAKEHNNQYLKIIYLPNYSMEMSKLLISGVDVWLNTPRISYEASGTSGMKASLNGVLNISTYDGWWPESGIHNINGWTISGHDEYQEINSMYDNIDNAMNTFYNNREKFTKMQRSAISLIGSYYNTHRMVLEYIRKGYKS
ncbi:MAG: GlgP2: glycogen phosphorylase [Candidatus Parcubacteria bacterium]|jgi:starch phosphorylase